MPSRSTHGTIFVGTQCDGIAIASSQDHYATWKQVTSANPTPHAVDGNIIEVPVPTVGNGAGLPTDLINDILVTQDHMVYAATNLGLAWSADHGNSWQFVRGVDWIDKVKNRIGGPPQGWQPPTDADKNGGILAEDYTTCLAEDGQHNLLVGHRSTAGDVLLPLKTQHSGLTKLDSSDNLYVTSYVPMSTSRNAYRGTYGFGMSMHRPEKEAPATLLSEITSPKQKSKNPSGASAYTTEILRKRIDAVKDSPARNAQMATFLGEDWMTQGDWVGRYGRQMGLLCASRSPFDQIVTLRTEFSNKLRIAGTLDPHFNDVDRLRLWLEGARSEHPSSLWNPFSGSRRQAIWDDHGEEYATSKEGPDIWFKVPLPEGVYRVSLYFFPYRHKEHALAREYRDLIIQVSDSNGGPASTFSRVSLSEMGVYKQYLLKGGKDYQFKIKRNFSYNTMINGIFIDQLSGPRMEVGLKSLASMGGVRYTRPEIPDMRQMAPDLLATSVLWSEFEHFCADRVEFLDQRRHAILAYRTMRGQGAAAASLASLRWSIPFWTPEEHIEWTGVVAQAWEKFLEQNPGLRATVNATNKSDSNK